jgi:hypothetical protein
MDKQVDRVSTHDPEYVEPPFECATDREHQAKAKGFSEGYAHGRDDLLFSLAAGHAWAVDALAKAKATS